MSAENIPMLLPGCGYTGRDFGASYEDTQCFGGILYDLDNCDEDGNLFEPLDQIPCPQCRHRDWLEQFKDEIKDCGFRQASLGLPRRYTHKPVRCEQRDDKFRMAHWWYRGFDQFVREAKDTTPQEVPHE